MGPYQSVRSLFCETCSSNEFIISCDFYAKMPGRTAQTYGGVSVEDRREFVRQLHERGLKIVEIASDLGVSRKVIRTDLKKLRLDSFSDIDDREVRHLIRSILATSHRASGLRYLDGQLLQRGFRR